MKYLYFSIFTFLFLLSCDAPQEDYNPEKNQPPSAFEINHIISQEDLVTLSWTEAVDPDGDKVTYSVFGEGTPIVEELTATYYTFTNLKSGTKYSGKIVASDEDGATSEVSYEFTTKGKPDNSDGGDSNVGNPGNFKIPDNLKSYYNSINFLLIGDKLRDELAALTIEKHTNFYEYSERHKFLYKASADPKNKENVLLIYSGGDAFWKAYEGNKFGVNKVFNTEHIYPQSMLEGNAANDLHNFAPCIISVNTERGKLPFTEGSGKYTKIGNSWYPGDDWRGDVARIIFYMNLRYDESFDEISTGGITLLLKWNAEDKVSEWEIQRNNAFEKAQGNRNPFIDNPYLANLIWDGQKAENLWK